MANTPQPTVKAKGEPPQYQLTEKAYIHDVLYEPGASVYFDGIPGPHMEPLNDAAKEMVKKHPPQGGNPIDALTMVGPGAIVLQQQRPGG
jgi:hypothetical protein